jgi:hypothetical protein
VVLLIWTALTGFGTGILELGDSTTRFDITNTAGNTYRYTYDATGTDPNVDHHIKVGSIVVIAAQNFTAANNGTFTVTAVAAAYFEVTNASGVVEANKTIGTGSIVVTSNKFTSALTKNRWFMANGDNDNMYVEADGTTVVTSADSTGHLYQCPKARKINYYKNRLYVGDYTVDDTRYKTTIFRSSKPLGLVSLVDGDFAAGVTTVTVTDTKYIRTTDSLDVYRGNTKIGTLTVSAKTEYELTVGATGFAIESADELWVADTFGGERMFRWTDNPASGDDVKAYDTFKLTSTDDDRIKVMTNIGDVMFIGTNNGYAVWNDYNLQNFDIGIGCVSDNGYAKALGDLYFIHYSGIYKTTGGPPQIMSERIRRIFEGATKSGLESAALGYQGWSIFASIGDVTLYHGDGSVEKTLSDVVVELDIRQNNWYVHTNIDADEFEIYPRTDGVRKMEYSSTSDSKHIYEFLYDEVDDAVTSNEEIPFKVITHNITLSGQFEKICYPKEIILEAERGSEIKCFVSLDNGDFYEIDGSARKGCSIFKVTSKNLDDTDPPRCRQIRVRFDDMSKNLCKISRAAIMYIESQEEEVSRPDLH